MKKDETFYDVLKVSQKATASEISAAYNAARNAFSKNSIAAYSLFTPEDAQIELTRLEQAYQVLSNVGKRRDYDKKLHPHTDVPASISIALSGTSHKAQLTNAKATQIQATPSANSASLASLVDGPKNGAWLATVRQNRSVSQEDICRLTRIPLRFLKAIETDDLPNLPIRVYLQGFVKNLAKTYQLDPFSTTKAYLDHIDALIASNAPTKKAA